jgi:hypothetical protein
MSGKKIIARHGMKNNVVGKGFNSQRNLPSVYCRIHAWTTMLMWGCFLCSHLGIKQVRFGGSEFESWNDSLNTEEAGYSVHKI